MRSWTIPERLPALRGWGLKLFTALWLVILPVAVLVTLSNAYANYQQTAQPSFMPLGIHTIIANDEVRVSAVFSREAQNSGIADRDRVIAIDGVMLPKSNIRFWTYQKINKGEKTTVILTIRSQNGKPREHILHWRETHVAEAYKGTIFSPQSAAIFVGGLTGSAGMILIISSILLFPRRKEPVAALLSLSFLTFALMLPGVLWETFGMTNVSKFAALPTGGIAVGILLFPEGKFNPRWSFWIMLMIIVTRLLSGFYSPLSGVPVLSFALALAVAILVLGLRYRRLSVISEQQQLRWAFFGFALSGVFWLAAGISIVLLFSPFGGQPFWYIMLILNMRLVSTLAILCLTGGLIISLLKYRLYDANIIISRSAAYGTLTLGFIAIFAGSEKMIELIGQRYFEDSIGVIAGGVGAAIAALLVVPLHNRVLGWAERRFQRELVSMREDLPETLGYLRETADEERLLASSLEQISHGVRSVRSAVLVIEDQDLRIAAIRDTTTEDVEAWSSSTTLDPNIDDIMRDLSDPLFPARLPLREATGETPVGWLLLGPRPDGSFFGKDERESLFQLTKPIARALKIVQVRRAREEANAKALTKVSGQITRVQRRLLAVEQKP